MPEKREDAKDRMPRIGVDQREDLIHQYRYTDTLGKRRAFYFRDLEALREKRKFRSTSTVGSTMPLDRPQ